MSALAIGDVSVPPGQRRRVELPVSRLPTETWMSVPVDIVNGAGDGPNLWISGAVHGDEVNGVEIIRRVLERIEPATLRGCLIAVPIVNVFGFIQQSRYLPDRRDLNRCFPGSSTGSMASRLAQLFMSQIVARCSYGIDLHTGSHHRENLPQIRANLRDPETRRCAVAFGAPAMMHAETRDGSLRQAATSRGVHVLLYEAGEALRFDKASIEVGTTGVLRVMRTLKMIRSAPKLKHGKPIEVKDGPWVRARRGGILRLDVKLGQTVARKERLGIIADAFGDNAVKLRAPSDGVVIGITNNPLVNQGDGLIHLGHRVPDDPE